MQLLTQSMLRACGITGEEPLLVGLSGGADSTALLLALCGLRDAGLCGNVFAAHLHHGIRGEHADGDATFCEALCERLAVPLTLGHADVPAYAATNGLSLETAARERRYAFLRNAMRQCGASCIVTAHHRDDQAETTLMHLLRGCGTNGLSGMRARTNDIARPLLAVGRAEIEAYLHALGQSWRTDETNADTKATRNRVRHVLMPLLNTFVPDAAGAIARSARLAGEDDAYLQLLAEHAAKDAAMGEGYVKSALLALPKPLCARVLRSLLTRTSADVTYADIERVYGLLAAQTGTCIELAGGRAAWVDSRCVYAGAYPQSVAYEIPFCRTDITRLPVGEIMAESVPSWRKPVSANEQFVDCDRLPEGLTVRTRRDGDRFWPLGAPGRRKLSDVLTDKKIPLTERDMPLLACGNEIYCVFGLTVSELAAITKETRHILHIEYRG